MNAGFEERDGDEHSAEALIARVRRALSNDGGAFRPAAVPRGGRQVYPDAYEDIVRQIGTSDGLVACFERAASAAGAHVRRAAAQEWAALTADVAVACKLSRVSVEAGLLDEFDRSAVEKLHGELARRHVAVSRDSLFTVDGAITGVAAAIAETGTIVCTSGAGRARGASLIPPVHVAVVGAAQILPDLYDFFATAADRALAAANLNLITGPSKTADIEGTLVTGVHGPGRLELIVIV